MKNTLYISDLDGTLLNKQQRISKEAVDKLNELINNGLNFSIATARTIVTVEEILKGLNLNIPVILMNGVALYDLKQHKYVDIEYIDMSIAQSIIEGLEKIGESGFIYTIEEHEIKAHYHKEFNAYETTFYNQRKHSKQFHKTKDINTSKIAYFVFIDTKERLERIANILKDMEAIDYVLYKDNYMEDAYFLEVFSHKASKANALMKLKKGYDKLVCFGDNLNDLSMFKLADYSCAMGNAVEEVKRAASQVILTNEENGVVKFIEECMK